MPRQAPMLPVGEGYVCGCVNGYTPVPCDCGGSNQYLKVYGKPHSQCGGTGTVMVQCPNHGLRTRGNNRSNPYHYPPSRSSRGSPGSPGNGSSIPHHATTSGM